MSQVLQFQGEYPAEKVFEAQDLYCVDRLTYEAVAERTGVSVPTLKRWGKEYGWRAKREELAKLESEIRFNTYRARAKMLAQVVAGGGALDAFAVAKLETLVLDQARFKNEQGKDQAAVPVEFESPAQAAELLEAALKKKLGAMIGTSETIDLKVVRDIRESFKLLSEMKDQAAVSTDKQAGLSLETEAKIKKILAGDL